MKVTPTKIPDVLLLDPNVFNDARGTVTKFYSMESFAKATGLRLEFHEDVHTRSHLNVLRGLHYQTVDPQGKLIRVVSGRIFDVAVDLRRSSPTFRQWVGFYLSGFHTLETDNRMAWIPPGFAHGYLTLSDVSHVVYKMTAPWHPEADRTLLWNDKDIDVRWPIGGEPLLSSKDAAGTLFTNAEVLH